MMAGTKNIELQSLEPKTLSFSLNSVDQVSIVVLLASGLLHLEEMGKQIKNIKSDYVI